MLPYRELTLHVYGPGNDPADLDPDGRIVRISPSGEPSLSVGLSEARTWDDVTKIGSDRREIAAIAWAMAAAKAT